jgi:prephenate dehydratase
MLEQLAVPVRLAMNPYDPKLWIDAMTRKIAFQGEPGAYSHMTAQAAFPDMEPLPCATFEDAFSAVLEGDAALAMIAIENSLAGRVPDVHQLLPGSGLHIIGERFSRIRHQLLGTQDATLEGVRRIRSHPVALGQCRKIVRQLGATAVTTADTAGAAREVAERGDRTEAAFASALAAEIHGLKILAPDVEDASHNTTRFVVLAADPGEPPPPDTPTVISFLFRVRNVPAALYKAMGGFATNGVNIVKLESYMINGSFAATQFFAEVDGHPENRSVQLALEELSFFSSELQILGVYPADPFRGVAKFAS